MKKISTGKLATPIARHGEQVLCEIHDTVGVYHNVVMDWQFSQAEINTLPDFTEIYAITTSAFTERRWQVGIRRVEYIRWF